MDFASGVPFNPGELNPRLSWLILQEMDNSRFKKDFYDADHPDNAKDLSDMELWQMARESIIQRLSVPPDPDGEPE